jgi:hypothetical protein
MTRISRAAAVLLSLALVHASFGNEAWAQSVQAIGDVAAPVGSGFGVSGQSGLSPTVTAASSLGMASLPSSAIALAAPAPVRFAALAPAAAAAPAAASGPAAAVAAHPAASVAARPAASVPASAPRAAATPAAAAEQSSPQAGAEKQPAAVTPAPDEAAAHAVHGTATGPDGVELKSAPQASPAGGAEVNFDGADQSRRALDEAAPPDASRVESPGPGGPRLRRSTARPQSSAERTGAVPQAGSSAAPAPAPAPAAAAPAAPRPGVLQYVLQGGMAVAAPLLYLKFHGGISAANALTVMSSMTPMALGLSAVTGALTGFVARRRAGGGTASAMGAAVGGALAGASTTQVLFNIVQMALNGFSVIGLNPLLTAISAAVLARTAIARLKDPTLSRGARLRAVLPAAAAALLLAVQTVLTLSIGSTPHLVAAAAIAVTALVAVVAALIRPGQVPGRGINLLSWGLVLQALMLGGALAVIAPPIAWPFVAAGGVGFLLSAGGAARAIFARRTPESAQPAKKPAAPPAEEANKPVEPPAQTAPAPAPAKKPKPSGDDVYDFRARPLALDDAQSLVIMGYRFDEASGRVLAPNEGKPVTVAEMRGLENGLKSQRARRALLRLDREASVGTDAARFSALVAANAGVLAPEVRRAAARGPEAAQQVIARRLLSLYRRWLDKPIEAPSPVRPVGGDLEEKLGALIADAAVARLSEDAEGRRLLDELREESGRLRLPTMRVLRLDERSGAVYTSYGRQLIVSLDYLRGRYIASLPEAERAEAARRMATEKDALDYLSEEPERAALVAAAVDVTIFHELVHFKQDLQRPLMGAMLTEEVPALFTLQHEYEAIHRQDLYIHSRLMSPGATLDVDRVDDYLRLIDDFDGWRGHVQDYYQTRLINGYGDVDELVELQARSQALIEKLAARAPSAAAQAKVAGAAAGAQAVARERAATAGLLEGYREDWAALAQEGLERWVALNAERGRWPQIAVAQERLARLADARAAEARRQHKASRPDAAEAVRLREAAQAARTEALRRLASGEGLTLDERLDWINALAADSRDRGVPWGEELWVAAFRDQTAKAAALREEAAKAPDERTRDALLQLAENFEATMRANRASLLSYGEGALATAYDADAPERAAFQALMAETYAHEGRWPEAVRAYERLAGRASDAAAAAALRAKAADARDRALRRVAAAEGMPLEERLTWIAALAKDFEERGMPWEREMWLASQRDYEQKIKELRAEETSAAEPARAELAARAEQFESTLAANRAALRGFAETNLAAARAETDAAKRASAISWGEMQADVLADAELIAAFKALAAAPPAPPAEAAAPAQAP